MNTRISIHHVGGRDGHGPFPLASRFRRDLALTFYEADADCVEQIKERNRYLQSAVEVLPYCLGAKTGEATLFINYDPYTSSLLPGNPAYRDYRVVCNYGAFGREFDYVLGQTMRTMEKRVVPTVSLDELLRAGRLGAAPDFLSIDTQGSEYDILLGAEEVLRQHTLAVSLEVEFHPMYAGQKLFGDVSSLLAGRGFLFIRFSREATPFTPGRAPIGLRGGGVWLNDDALFLRSVASVKQMPDERQRGLMLHKLAFLAVLFDQVELAVESLAAAAALETAPAVRQELAGTEYGRFLEEFWAAVQRQPRYFPATFDTEFTFEASRSRFATAGRRGIRWLELIRDWCVRKPERWRGIKRMLQPVSAGGRRLVLLAKLALAGKPFWRHPALQWRSEVERVLRRYGLHEQEKIVRRNRWRHAPFCEEEPPPARAGG
jgi:FkbM family methyltransferase